MEKIKTTKIEKQKLTITDIECKTNDNEKIIKVIMETDKGTITLKPMIETSEFHSGIKIMKKVNPSSYDQLPENLKKFGKMISGSGKARVIGDYMILVSSEDNISKEFYFVYPTQFKSWVVDDTPCYSESEGLLTTD